MDTIDALGLLPTLLEIKGIIYDKVVGFDEKIRRKFVNALKVALKPTLKDDNQYINKVARQIDDLISLVILVMDEPSSINTITLPNYITREEFRRFYAQTNKDEELQDYLANKLHQCQNKGIFTEVKATGHKVDKLIESNEEIKGGIKEIKQQLRDNTEVSNVGSIHDLYKCLDNKLHDRREIHPSFQLMEIDDRLFPDARTKTKKKQIKLNAIDSNDELKTVKDIIEESWGKGEKNHLMIEGDGGIGKTVTLLSIPDAEKFAPHYVPAIYIPLHELSSGEDPIERYIKKHILNHNQVLFEQLLELANEPWVDGPRLLLLLDGFNEITTEQRVPLGKDIGFWSEFSGVQIITSSRYDIHSYVAFGKNYSAIKLQTLSDQTVEDYLRSMDIRIPTEDAVKKLITTPLLLTLYAMTERVLEERECDSSEFKEVKSAGSIVWNYLQCELWNFGKEGENAKNAIIAMEFIAPYIAWKMQQETLFVLNKKKFHDFLEKAYQLLENHFYKINLFPFHISDAIQKSNGIPSVDLIRSLLENKFCIFVKNGDYYRLMHQQFRDALAAMHLINSSYLSGVSLPDEWKTTVDYYVMQFVVDLINEDEAMQLWEQNRKTQPAIENATRNQLRLQGLLHNNDFSHLDFSGIDLSSISLYPYRYSNTTIKLPLHKDRINETKLSDKTFAPEGHEGSVNAVTVTPNGKYIVSGSSDKTIRIWDVENGAQIMILEGHEKDVNAVAVDKDGKYIISGSSDKTIRIWDLKTGLQNGEPLIGHEGIVNAVAINDECTRIVSGSSDHTVRFWDFKKRMEIGDKKMKHDSAVSAVAITPDGHRIVSGSMDNTICLWDLETGDRVGEPIKGHEFSVNAISLVPDGSRIISGSNDKTIRIWNTETYNSNDEKIIECQYGPVFCLATTCDGTRVVSGSGSNYISVWNANTLKSEIPPIKGHKTYVNSVAVTPDGKRIISGSADKTIGIWDLNSGESMMPIEEGHSEAIYSVLVTNDDRFIISRSSDKLIRIWDLETKTLLGKLDNSRTNSLNCIAMTKDGKRIVSALRSYITVYDLKTSSLIRRWKVHNYPETKTFSFFRQWEVHIIAVDLTPDGKYIISRDENGTICIWDLKTGEYIRSLKGHDNSYIEFTFSIDGKKFIGKSNRYTYIWDIETGELQKESGEYNLQGLIQKKKFEAIGLDNGIIRITNMENNEIQTIRVLSLSITEMDFSNSEMSDEVRELFRQNGAKV